MAFGLGRKSPKKNAKVGSRAGEIFGSALKDQAKKNFAKDKITFFSFIFAFGAFLGQGFLIAVSWRSLPLKIPLFYSRPWGESMLVEPLALWALPAIVLVFSIINFLVISLVPEHKFLTKTIGVFTILMALTTFWGTWKIISLLV